MPELDGLRAVAILVVLAFHLEFPWFSLGWAGVPLFFVLSGFLITGILMDARGAPNYLRNFYVRRAFRIFPIYYLTLFAVAAAAIAMGQRIDSLPFYLLYTQNYLLGATNFNPQFPVAFNHSWSLAIEEQFYLAWPFAVMWLGRRKLLALAGSMFGIGLAARAGLLAATGNPALMDASLPGQLDALSAGAGLAILLRSGVDIRALSRKAALVMVVSGSLLLVMVSRNGLDSYWHPDTWATQPQNLPTLSLLALFFAALVALALAGAPLLSRLLAWNPLRHVGKISYGIYMFHFPIFVLVDKTLWKLFPGEPNQLVHLAHPAGKIALTYLLALVSWRVIESPLLRLKSRFEG